MNTELETVGQRKPCIDGVEKVSGKAIFGMDMVLPGMLHAKILRSPYAHARIKKINIEKARQCAGVHTVITALDIPDVYFGLNDQDERFFAKDEVLYIGDELAAIVAIDEKTAAAALQHIEVEYEPLPAVFDVSKAAAENSPLVRMDKEGNISHQSTIQRGNIEKGFKEASVICEKTFYLPHQYHGYLEPHTATANWQNNRLTIWAPHQSPEHLEVVIRQAFNLPPGGFRFLQTHIGGGFGGKTHMRTPLFAALLAKHAQKPVRLSLTRQEDFEACMPAVPMMITVKLGARSDGTITAKEVDILADNGAYTACAQAVVYDASIAIDNLYRFENIKTKTRLVYTNKLGTSGLRGFGNPQITFAVESMMDILATELNMDPAELRLHNAIQSGDTSVHGWEIKHCNFTEAINLAMNKTDWKNKRGKMRSKNRGIGMACAVHKSGTSVVPPLGSTAIIRIHEDGSVHVSCSEGDSGQGAKTVFAQIAAEELGVPYEQIHFEELDTDKTNFSSGVIGSRVTFMGGNAVKLAATAARQRVIESAANYWQCDPGEIQIYKGELINTKTEETLTYSDSAMHYFKTTGGNRISEEGIFLSEGVIIPGDDRYGNISQAYPFAVHVAEVEVDIETGKVQVQQFTAVHDAGQIINPMLAEGQIEGAILMGMGYALTEEYIFSPDGKVLNGNFTNFRMPTSLDIPKYSVLFTSSTDKTGPFGAKSIGEICLVPVAPAIANAIYDATGIPPNRLPINPEWLFSAIESKKREKIT